MKKSAWVVAVVGVVLLAYVGVGPYLTVHQIRTAIEQQDSEKLESNIDFPALRANLKEQLNAALMTRAMDEAEDNPLALLGMALGSHLVEGMVDAMVTPTGIANLMAGRKAWRKAVASEPDAPGAERPKVLENPRYRLDGLSRVSVRVHARQGKEVRLVLTRHWLSWKLSNIILPLDTEQNSGTDRPDKNF